MARFIGYVQGQAGEVSRLGSPRSGITAQAQGWNAGVKVYGHTDGDDVDDVFEVHMTAGSNGGLPSKHLGTVRIVDGVPVFTVTGHYRVETEGGIPFKVVV